MTVVDEAVVTGGVREGEAPFLSAAALAKTYRSAEVPVTVFDAANQAVAGATVTLRHRLPLQSLFTTRTAQVTVGAPTPVTIDVRASTIGGTGSGHPITDIRLTPVAGAPPIAAGDCVIEGIGTTFARIVCVKTMTAVRAGGFAYVATIKTTDHDGAPHTFQRGVVVRAVAP